MGREVANRNRIRQGDNCSSGLWLQKLFQSSMPYSPLTLRPTSSGRLCCPVLLVGPSAFVGSPPCSHHCPSIYLHWALSCSSRSLSERTEHQADSHSIPVLTQLGDVGLCFTVKCAGQPMTVRDTSRAVTPQCRDTNARECLKVR